MMPSGGVKSEPSYLQATPPVVKYALTDTTASTPRRGNGEGGLRPTPSTSSTGAARLGRSSGTARTTLDPSRSRDTSCATIAEQELHALLRATSALLDP